MEWFYRRSGTITESAFMLNSGWFESGAVPYLVPNLLAEAGKDFGIDDDRLRLALSHAALRDGRRIARDLRADVGAHGAPGKGRVTGHPRTSRGGDRGMAGARSDAAAHLCFRKRHRRSRGALRHLAGGTPRRHGRVDARRCTCLRGLRGASRKRACLIVAEISPCRCGVRSESPRRLRNIYRNRPAAWRVACEAEVLGAALETRMAARASRRNKLHQPNRETETGPPRRSTRAEPQIHSPSKFKIFVSMGRSAPGKCAWSSRPPGSSSA
jgi:hypothetical protein